MLCARHILEKRTAFGILRAGTLQNKISKYPTSTKRCSTSPIIRKIQINTTTKYYYPLKWLKFKKMTTNVGEDVKQMEQLYIPGSVTKSYNQFGKLFDSIY